MIRKAWKVLFSTGSILGVRRWTPLWSAISRRIVVSIMNRPEPFCVLPVLIGLILSERAIHSPSCIFYWYLLLRIKENLRSGELAVSGDQWPIFLYQGYAYDADDPWNGLCRSAILVSVKLMFDWLQFANGSLRRTNIYLLRLALLTKNQKQLGLVTRVSMEWPKSPPRRLLTLLHKWVVSNHPLFRSVDA